MIKLNLEHTRITDKVLEKYGDKVKEIHKMIKGKTGPGSDFLGWTTWPNECENQEFKEMIKLGKKLNKKIDVLVVAGIGGSYLGARAAIEFVKGLLPKKGPEVIYLGNSMSSTHIKQVLDYIKDKEYAINVISKSGTTTETAIAFRLLKNAAEKKYGKNAKDMIIATTDASKGALRELANKEGYKTFTINDDIGGRFSGITPVGLFPMAVAGLDIKKVVAGAKKGTIDFGKGSIKNLAYQYAVARCELNKDYATEVMVAYEPQMAMMNEWWKQLFGESEGKDGKGLFPASVVFSTDLHSLGQYVQDGKKTLFETVVTVKEPTYDLAIPKDKDNLDNLNYLAKKKVSFVNQKAFEGTLDAHVNEGKVPNILIEIEKMDEEVLGYYWYFMFRAVAMSGYLLDVNPFDQPGVEIYKRNMFKLLGKPGSN